MRKALRVLEKESGFSRSALSRHDRGCLFREKLNRHRDRCKRQFKRIVVKDETTSPPRWHSYNPFDEYDEAKPFHGPFRADDLFIALSQDPLQPEVLERLAQTQQRPLEQLLTGSGKQHPTNGREVEDDENNALKPI